MGVTIPNFADLGFNDPRSVGGLPNYPAESPVAAGEVALGKGITAAGGAAEDVAAYQQMATSKLERAISTADLDGNLIRAKEALKHETDPAKVDAIKAAMPSFVARAGGGIRDPNARALWTATHQPKIDEALGVADERQRTIYDDRFRAGASQQLDEQERLAAQASDPAARETAKANIGSIVGSMEQAGVISAAKAQELMLSYGHGIITGHVQWLDANDQPAAAAAFLRDNSRFVDPKTLNALTTHLRPRVDKRIALSEVEQTAPSAAGGVDQVDNWETRNNNFGGLRKVGVPAAGPEAGGFQSFASPEEGVTAISRQLDRYASGATTGKPVNTLRGIVSTWAPPSENPTDQLIARAAKVTGFDPDQALNVSDPAVKAKLIEATIRNEQAGKLPVGAAVIAKVAGLPGAGRRIDETTNPALAAEIDAAPAAGEPVPLDLPAGPPDWRGWVDRINTSARLTPEQKDMAIAEVHRRMGQYTLGQAQRASDLELGVTRGEVTRDQIETDYRDQRISPEKRVSLNNAITKIEEQRALEEQARLRVGQAGNGGAPLDPKSKFDKDALNLHFDETLQGWTAADKAAGDQPGRPTILDRSVAYAGQYGLVPEKLKAMIRGGLHSGKADEAIVAASTVDRLRNVNPQLVGDLGDENDLRLATLISKYTSDGMAPQGAVQRAIEGMKVSKTDSEARVEQFKELRGKTLADQQKSDSKWLGDQKNHWFARDPDTDPRMRKEFEELSQDEFAHTGDLEAARRMALGNIDRVWGRTQVGGAMRYMKLAPEKYYGIPSLSEPQNSAWMNEQLLSDIKQGAFQDPNNPITADRLRLEVDPTHLSARGWPAYQVWLARDGTFTHQKDATGVPLLWAPDWGRSAEYKRRQDATQSKIDAARATRERPTQQRQENLEIKNQLTRGADALPE